MRKSLVVLLIGIFAGLDGQAVGLTPTELRWLQGAWPVLMYARDAGLPLDVVVQPQPAPGLPPVALAFIDGRCKFVLSLRDNPEVEATVARTDPLLMDAALELMAAHELGHCRRHVSGAWRAWPPALAAPGAADLPPQARAAYEEMQAVRREEAYGDLVGLAWIGQRRSALFERMHAWLVAERSHAHVAGGHHDTLAWVALARTAQSVRGSDIFEPADLLFPQGLDAAR